MANHNVTASPQTSQTRLAGNVRCVQCSDGPAIHALLSAGRISRMPELQHWLKRWQWATWDNPFRNDRPAGWVVLDHNRIIGHLGAVYAPFIDHGSNRTAMIAVVPVVDATKSNGNADIAIQQLAQAFFAGSDNCVPIITAADPQFAAAFIRSGCHAIEWTRQRWRMPANITQMIQTIHGGKHRLLSNLFATAVGRRTTHWLENVYRRLGRLPRIPVPTGCRMEITTPRLANDHCLMNERSNQGATIGIDRSPAYLRWRYAEHPEHQHIRVVMIRNSDEHPIAAAIVYIEEMPGRRIAYIEDLEVADNRRDLLHTLMAAALRTAIETGAQLLITTAGRYGLDQLYAEFGFRLQRRRGPAVLIDPSRVSCNAETLQTNFELWHGGLF